MKTGERIRERRMKIGMSLNELADILGRDRTTIYRYETDKIENMPTFVLGPLAKALNTSPAYLMGWTDDPSATKKPRTMYEPPRRYENSTAGDRIDIVMALRGYGINRMAKELGGSTTPGYFAKILDGDVYPDKQLMERIASILGVNEEWLVGETDDVRFIEHIDHNWANPLIDSYTMAPEPTQENVCKLLDVPHVRPGTARPPLRQSARIKMQVYNDPCAAGIPIYAESDFEFIEFEEDDVPSGADFGIRIAGDSMEPTIENGQIVWIRRQYSINNGQIGVFMLEGGEAVCKRARCKADGQLFALESDNSTYKPIKGDSLGGLRIVGRVLI